MQAAANPSGHQYILTPLVCIYLIVYNFISRKVREEGIRIGFASPSEKKSHVKVDGVFPCRCGVTVGSKPVAMTVRGSKWIHG